jgi:uncharacterized protein (DUF305 family)
MVAGAVLAAVACNDATGPDDASVAEQVAYIDGIVPHHQIATMMADEALAKAVHPGLMTIAQRMKEDQGREIAQFQSIRGQLVGVDTTTPPMMPAPIPAGPDFDREWLTMMINHHQGAIDMSTLAHGTGVSATLDSLAHHTIEEQQREQAEFRDSLRVWYPSP